MQLAYTKNTLYQIYIKFISTFTNIFEDTYLEKNGLLKLQFESLESQDHPCEQERAQSQQ